MKTLKHILSLACVLSGLVFFACESDEQNPHKDKNNSEQKTHQPLGDLDVHPMGDTIIMSYTSAVDWVLETDSSDVWRTISPKQGKAGTTELTITVDPYLNDGQIGQVEGRPRDSYLKFKDAVFNYEIDGCTITQELAYIIVEGDVNNSFDFDYCDVAAKKVTIKSNIDFQIDIEGFDFTLKEDDNDVNGSIINPNGAPRTIMLSAKDRYYITASDNGFAKREASLRISPLSRSYNTAGSLEYKTVDNLDALEYDITQDYRVMILTADEPTKENWSTLLRITETNALSPFGANYLVSDSNGENDSEATTTFYCIYDLRGEGRVDPVLTTETEFSDDISLELDGASFEIETEDELEIWCQKYIATVNTPNTDLMNNRPIACSVMDTDVKVQSLSVVQNHFDFSLQYEKDGQMTDVSGTIPYSYTAGDAKEFEVKTSEEDLKWSMEKISEAFDCVGIHSGEEYSGDKTFAISTAATNYSISDTQSTNVKISPMLGDIKLQTISFTLDQEAFLFKFADNNEDSIKKSFAVDATTYNVGFRSYGDLIPTVEQGTSWLTAEAVNEGNNSYNIKLTFTEPDGLRGNENKSVTIEDRSTTVSIVSAIHAAAKPQGMSESDYTKTIIVNQAGYEFTVDGDKIDKVAAGGGVYEIGVTCTNTYSVDGVSDDWITVAKSADSKKAIITVSKNETDKEREGTFSIVDQFNNSYEISVTQEAGEKPEEEPEVNPDDDNTEEEVTE